MLAFVSSCGLTGIEGFGVSVEVNLAHGMPLFEIVGLPDASVKESRERVRTALKNSGFFFPAERLIVNLATGAGLSWFFIVLTAMFIPASLTVVPLMMPDNKALWTLGAFTVSLLTLLGVCCIYSGGSWFLTAGSSVLFGLTMFFLPFVVNAKPIARRLGNNKALAAMGGCTFTYLLMMICIGIGSETEGFFGSAAAYSIPVLAWIWTMFALLRYTKWGSSFKIAACIFASSLFFFLGDTLVTLLLGNGLRFPKFDFSQATAESRNDSVCWAALFTGIFFAALFAIVGAVQKRKHK